MTQTWLMALEIIAVSALFLGCFRARAALGLVPLYTVLGVAFYACNFLAASVYVRVAPNLVVSPGTVVLFPALLSVLLLIYITEDAIEARKLIYGLLVANVFTAGLGALTAAHLTLPGGVNIYRLSPDAFAADPRVGTVSVVALFADSIVIILLYELVSRYTRHLFWRIYLSMSVTLALDTLVFITGAYVDNPNYLTFLSSAMIGKLLAAVPYAILFAVYLRYLDVVEPVADARPIGRMFRTLTYRQKFELLRESERQLRAMLEASPIAIAVGTRGGRTLFCNSRYADIFGIPAGDDGLGTDEVMGSYVDPADRERLVEATYGPAGRADEVEVERVRRDGTRCWSVVWWRRIAFEGQDAHISWLYDATERRRAAEELGLAKEAAEAATAAKSDFLATMSHEIRTPLNGILSNIELLAYTNVTPEQVELVRAVDVAAGALVTIIGEVLDFSKIEAGKIELEQAEMVAASLVEEVASLMAPLARQKGLRFESSVASDVPGIVAGDALRVRQVLMNLVGNAIKFTDRGSVLVELTRVARDGDVVHLRFAVTDTGIGFDPAKADALFAPFVQADESTTRRFGGTGLGLPISRELVRLMGGALQCSSQPDAGASFWFTIPLRVVDETAAPVESHDVETLFDGELASLTNGRRILVAEDNPMNQLVIRRQLDKLGLPAEITGDGAAALAAWEREDFALLLADVTMPDVDGYELTRRIRTREASAGGRPHTPIIALTANALSGEAARAAAAGMDAYLTKPVGLPRLAVTLRRWLAAAPQTEDALPAEESLSDAGSAASPLDVEQLKANLGLTDGEVAGVLAYFVETQQPLIAAINAHVAARQAPALQNRAHAAKGAARNACAPRLAASLTALEGAAGEADWVKVDQILPSLDAAFAEVKRAIDEAVR